MTNSIKLQYSVEYSPLEHSTCLGILFNTEEEAWSYLDLVALKGTILEASISTVPTPPQRYVFATNRSWEGR